LQDDHDRIGGLPTKGICGGQIKGQGFGRAADGLAGGEFGLRG
jgi:hypothetical protein